MSKQVALKKNGPFSHRIPLMAQGPQALCRYRHQTTARLRRLYKVAYPTSFCLSLPAYGIKTQPKVITYYTQFTLGEALLHTAFNKRAVTMHRSLMSTRACREPVRCLSLQGSNSHREQTEKGRLFRRREPYGKEILQCTFTKTKQNKKVKNTLDTFKSSVCLYVGIEGKIKLQKWELWVPEQLWSSLPT